jgi:hypothetical protein
MRDDDSACCHAWGDLAQAPCDVLVGEPVEPVPPDALAIVTLRDREVVRYGAVAVMKGGVEAGDLR